MFGRKAVSEALDGQTVADLSGLDTLKGELASTPEERKDLFAMGLQALIDAGEGSFVIFECKEQATRYVQFQRASGTANLQGEVGGQPVAGGGAMIVENQGFEPSSDANPNYAQAFNKPLVTTVAEQVESVFLDALGCDGLYTAHVVDAVREQ